METTSPPVQKKNNLAKAILFAGLLAGLLDASAASIQYYIKTGKSPVIVFKYISSALFGKDAFAGGNAMAACGLALHFLIAMLFTLFFFIIYPRLSRLSGNIIVNAIAYGLFTWVVMNLLIVPMTQIPKRPFNTSQAIQAMVILIFCIGLPVSYFASRYYRRRAVRS